MTIQNTLLSHIMKFHIKAVLSMTFLCHMTWFWMYIESAVSQTLDINQWKVGTVVLSDVYGKIWTQICVLSHSLNLMDCNMRSCRSQWPCGLTHMSAAARLLRLWVRIPPVGHGCLSVVSVVCCQVEVSATGRSLVQGSPTDCVASCVI